MAGLLLRSLELVHQAALGEDISEQEDLDKRLAILNKELEGVDSGNEAQLNFNQEIAQKVFKGWFSDLVKKAVPIIRKFDSYFIETGHSVRVGHSSTMIGDSTLEDLLKKLGDQEKEKFNSYKYEMTIQTVYRNFRKAGLNSFGCSYGIKVTFEEINYVVEVDVHDGSGGRRSQLVWNRLLHQVITDDEQKELAKKLGDAIYDLIDHESKKAGLR